MKKIKAFITNSTKENAWVEKFDIPDIADSTDYMENLINSFNNSLRPNERPRMLISVEDEADNGTQQHEYEKINLVTIHGRNGMYDTCKCNICGVTGKRYGISGIVQRDSKYKAKCYENCTTTLKHLHR